MISKKKTFNKKEDYDYKDKFIYDSRLNKLQRKYCSCVNKVRTKLSKKNKTGAYPICYSSLRKNFIRQELDKETSNKSINKGNNSLKNKKKDKRENKKGSKKKNYLNLSKTKFNKLSRKFNKSLKNTRTNCVMNYDFRRLSENEIINIALEKKIPTEYSKNGIKHQFKKSTLVKSIKNKYLDRKLPKNKNTRKKSKKSKKK